MARFEIEIPDATLARFAKAYAAHSSAIAATPMDYAGRAAASDELAKIYGDTPIVRPSGDEAMYLISALVRAETYWQNAAHDGREAARRAGEA